MGKSTISMAMFNSHVKLPECKYASDLNVGSKFWWLRYPEWIHCCNFTVAETGLGGWWFQPGRSALRRPSWWLVSTCWRQRLDLDLAHSVGKWWWYKCDIYIYNICQRERRHSICPTCNRYALTANYWLKTLREQKELCAARHDLTCPGIISRPGTNRPKPISRTRIKLFTGYQP